MRYGKVKLKFIMNQAMKELINYKPNHRSDEKKMEKSLVRTDFSFNHPISI